ncbi:MAG: hypothetical protein OHK0053_04120 [Microscillaceae bacterium]
MKHLEEDWLTRGLIDYEYKKYVLLAYLQEVKKQFEQVRLYPYLSDLVFHYQNLRTLRQNQELLLENFPKEISRADFEKLSLEYKKIAQDDSIMQEMEEIIFFALPQIKQVLEEGKSIHDYVEENLEISPVGITPLREDEGYLFLREKNQNELAVYEYKLSVFESAQEKFQAIHAFFIENVALHLGLSLESVKLDLIRRYRKMMHPATYLIYSALTFPRQETLLPIAKRLLVRYLKRNG